MSDGLTIAVFGVALALAALCIALLLLAGRRVLRRHEEMIASMMNRYDYRLGEFAQTLNDALTTTLPARIQAAISGAPAAEQRELHAPDHGVSRLLEVARDRTGADAAVAVVSNQEHEPILATVGLSDAEAAQVGGLGVPDYHGARAIQVSFNAEAEGGNGGTPIRAGLVVPLLDPPNEPGMLAVLTRQRDRQFGEIDITTLEDVLSATRPGIETSLELREPDPVPERDALTTLFDRPAFHALLEREIARARGTRGSVTLLMLDVDRLTTLNARLGQLAADEVLARVASLIEDVAGPRDLTCRIGGGRFGVILADGRVAEAEALFERVQRELHERPLSELGVITVSGGVAELLPTDDAAGLVIRADSALGLAKGSGRDTVVTAARR
jgi:diguanylate cyclase (GGDEF)-like protein